MDDVNYKFYHNKDGKYAWRKFQLINPILYVYLVNEITKKNNWNTIKIRFGEFKKNPNIICCSDLVESTSKNKDKGATINNWWNEIEQQSIMFALDYEYIGITDVVDCYGAIYTHSIAWAVHGLGFAKSNRDISHIGNLIDSVIQNMSYGQTNGIPQGSTLMDFIAECVLGYGDLLISKKLAQRGINDYKILRYRDDYRVFANQKEDINEIIKVISEELSKLNMKLNAQKTQLSNDIISNAIKKEKIASLDFEINKNISIQKNLLKIRFFSIDYPNAGRTITLLNNLYKELIEPLKNKPDCNEVLISIVVDIMYNNTKAYQSCAAILSKLLYYENEETLYKILESINRKFKKIPNTDYLSVFMQRITLKYNREYAYESSICKLLYDDNIKLWNCDWCGIQLDEKSIIVEDEIEAMDKVIPVEDLEIFERY
ncbi:MAG: RNA-directed DNA polymerase [Clostridia bacterium]|nr:RNA-directed DNA polymerase [Clostridia bacterium]